MLAQVRRAVPPRVCGNRENREIRIDGIVLNLGGAGGLRWWWAGPSHCEIKEREEHCLFVDTTPRSVFFPPQIAT